MLKILLVSLLSAAASAKGVYVEGATTDSSVVEADVAAAKLGANEAPRRGLGGQSDDRRMDQTAEAVVAAAKLGANEAPAANHRGLACSGAICGGVDMGKALKQRCMRSCVANWSTCSWYCSLMVRWHYG